MKSIDHRPKYQLLSYRLIFSVSQLTKQGYTHYLMQMMQNSVFTFPAV